MYSVAATPGSCIHFFEFIDVVCSIVIMVILSRSFVRNIGFHTIYQEIAAWADCDIFQLYRQQDLVYSYFSFLGFQAHQLYLDKRT